MNDEQPIVDNGPTTTRHGEHTITTQIVFGESSEHLDKNGVDRVMVSRHVGASVKQTIATMVELNKEAGGRPFTDIQMTALANMLTEQFFDRLIVDSTVKDELLCQYAPGIVKDALKQAPVKSGANIVSNLHRKPPAIA